MSFSCYPFVKYKINIGKEKGEKGNETTTNHLFKLGTRTYKTTTIKEKRGQYIKEDLEGRTGREKPCNYNLKIFLKIWIKVKLNSLIH